MRTYVQKETLLQGSTFEKDVIRGLQATPKYLQSKYFYNKEGDRLFQKIMHCPEYYLTDCELEIFKEQSEQIIQLCQNQIGQFDIVELGAVDAFKSKYLLKAYQNIDSEFTYFPIDISQNIIRTLENKLPEAIPQLKIHGYTGEYLSMLSLLQQERKSERKKLVLFLGSSLGNMNYREGIQFLNKVRNILKPGDLLLLGLDLVKKPEIILCAYNDKEGYTKAFNLNLLERINRKLGGNFHLDCFAHFPTYDIENKACKSYLISLVAQQVQIGNHLIHFQERETIHMETSQKYDSESIRTMMNESNFTFIDYFYDSKKWFVDTLWLV